ncbi:hypothetical protein PF005_g28267 [Phytophthora fragariae]|uniref:Uncharacterized protein n=1 Tax=Phytophthora fragariae TaxID=53985 RepID=A0A6A4BKS8_9STRA|nr:hypothetical protein PF003_g30401 [Phytophthora fragariae]KAE8920890.1 hypothetical protein PF009_g28821 [Phytophthora fragariae]KAE9067755.1 hypothetical protein PF007_g27948 [Phytophthora fragariae]KAE9084226.1 hypothetical protein PF010_g20922 [Phytophthora fragariae]KAE9104399.1 hypothetical protein PF006_g21907 [Phytophthora fragariae]
MHPVYRVFKPVAQWLQVFAGRLPGEYTVAKLDAFDCFRLQTSPWQVTGILLLTPMGCLVANVLIESIPLSDPATGFYGSLHFQARNFLVATTVMTTLITTKVSCVSHLTPRSWRFICGMSLTLAGVAIATNAVISIAVGIFPVPFTQFAPTGPMAVIGGLINQRFLETPENRVRLQRLDRWLAMDLAPILIYPIFTAVFMAVQSTQQLWLSLLLPVLKFLLRYLLWLVVRGEIDLVGAATCSVGHLYHILFTVMCLQNAKSWKTYAVVIAVNTIQMLLNCRGILQDSDEIRRTAEQLTESPGDDHEDAVTSALTIAQQENVAKLLHRKRFSRFFSLFPGYQHADYVSKHQKLLRRSSSVNLRHSSVPNVMTNSKVDGAVAPISKMSTPILPTKRLSWKISSDSFTTEILVASFAKRGEDTRQVCAREQEAYVRQVTSALHQTEIVLLRSYITIFALPFYGLYQALLFSLPNRRYFVTMATTTTFDAVAGMIFHMLVLCGLELLFLVVYVTLISHRLGFSGLHQLAFVLWSQRILIQGKFIMLPPS